MQNASVFSPQKKAAESQRILPSDSCVCLFICQSGMMPVRPVRPCNRLFHNALLQDQVGIDRSLT